MTHVSTPIFQGLLKNIVFRSVALVIKKLRAILDFFYTLRTFYRPVPNPMHEKKKLQKKPLNYYFWKVKKFHGDSVKNESARAKKLEGGGCQTPPPSLFRVKEDGELMIFFRKLLKTLESNTELYKGIYSPWMRTTMRYIWDMYDVCCI